MTRLVRLLLALTLCLGTVAPLSADDPDPLFINLTTDDAHRANMALNLGANDHDARATPEHESRERHGRFPHPCPLPRGEGEKERAPGATFTVRLMAIRAAPDE